MEQKRCKIPAEALKSKRTGFRNGIRLVTESLKLKNYFNSELLYGSLLSDLHDTSIEELQLNELEVFSLHCCFAYCCIAVDFKSERGLLALSSLCKSIQLPLVPYLQGFVHLASDDYSSAAEALSACQKLLDDGYNFKPNEILSADVVPEIADEFLKTKLNGLQFACSVLKDNPKLRDSFVNNWMRLGVLCKTDYAKMPKKSPTSDRGTSPEKKATAQVQTGTVKKEKPKVRTASVGVQTTQPKSVNVAVQTAQKEPVNKELMGAILDIKSRVNNLQSKKDDEVKKLQRKVNELTDKLPSKEKNSPEFDFLKEQYVAMENKLEKCHQETLNLHRMLLEQVQQKNLLQKAVYSMCEARCTSRIEFLSEIQNYLSPTTSLTPGECVEEVLMWEKLFQTVRNSRKKFEARKNSDQADAKTIQTVDIPQMPADDQDIVYRKFKAILQQGDSNIYASFVWPPQNSFKEAPNQNAAPNQNLDIGKYIFDGTGYNFSSPAFAPSIPNSTDCEQLSEDDWVAGSPPSPRTPSRRYANAHPIGSEHVRQKNCKQKNGKEAIRYESEKELFEYLKAAFSEFGEFELLNAVFQVRDGNGGTLVGLPRSKLVTDVRKLLRKGKRSKPAWSNVNTPQVQWHNDHSEKKCCICFDDFTATTSYMLPCQHEFHKKCIKSWLKRQSACPVCRVHAVIDEDFPPLK